MDIQEIASAQPFQGIGKINTNYSRKQWREINWRIVVLVQSFHHETVLGMRTNELRWSSYS